MIATNFNGVNVVILNDAPSFSYPFEIDAESVSDATEGLTNREARRSYSKTLRFTVQFSVVSSGVNLRGILGQLRSLEAQPVLMPFWPAVSSWSARASSPIIGGLMVAFKSDWSQFELYTNVEPGWPAPSDLVAPVLYGFLQAPRIPAHNPDLGVFVVDFVESSKSDYAISTSITAFDDGPKPAGYAAAPKLFPFQPIFQKVSLDENVDVKIGHDDIGLGRVKLTNFYPHDPFEGQDSRYVMGSTEQLARMLYWFRTYGSQGASFWVQSSFASTYLGADAAFDATSIQITDTAAVQINDQLCAQFSDGSIKFALVDSIVGNTVTLDAAFGTALPNGRILRRLLLAKLETNQLKIQFRGTTVSWTQLQWTEVRPEVFVPGDETIGTTIGQLPERCFLYDLIWTLGGAIFHERISGYESSLTYAGNLFTAKLAAHDSIRQGLFLDNDKVVVTLAMADSPTMQKLARLSMEAPVFLSIIQAEVSGANAINGQVIFYGEVTVPSVSGFVVKPQVVSAGTKFDRSVPFPNVQRDCNNALFDAGCTLSKDDWKWTAKVNNPGAVGYPFAFIFDTLTAPVGNLSVPNADWFAGGWVVFGSGASLQRRAILTHTNPVAGVLTVTLDRDPDPFPSVNDPVLIFPGCDGLFTTCVNKFNNLLNFLGFPYLPFANPSFVKKQQTAAGGKK